MDINDIFETAHISITSANLKVAVNDLSKYKVLWEPRSTQIDDDIYEVDMAWFREMGFPLFVMDVSPWYDDYTLIVHVSWPFDIKELSDWLKQYE